MIDRNKIIDTLLEQRNRLLDMFDKSRGGSIVDILAQIDKVDMFIKEILRDNPLVPQPNNKKDGAR